MQRREMAQYLDAKKCSDATDSSDGYRHCSDSGRCQSAVRSKADAGCGSGGWLFGRSVSRHARFLAGPGSRKAPKRNDQLQQEYGASWRLLGPDGRRKRKAALPIARRDESDPHAFHMSALRTTLFNRVKHLG
jgi:hypothetical protein